MACWRVLRKSLKTSISGVWGSWLYTTTHNERIKSQQTPSCLKDGECVNWAEATGPTSFVGIGPGAARECLIRAPANTTRPMTLLHLHTQPQNVQANLGTPRLAVGRWTVWEGQQAGEGPGVLINDYNHTIVGITKYAPWPCLTLELNGSSFELKSNPKTQTSGIQTDTVLVGTRSVKYIGRPANWQIWIHFGYGGPDLIALDRLSVSVISATSNDIQEQSKGVDT
ncbi:hypothetical protein BKA56DRAFT_351808 [Ilyonectria sp. MPI-CAGE-AT-0026]|nr:hypothetical protein BKA56DRAFT_351808 [Ilyonectria sp. MPI-CAGE-AT-0026]